eukprot:CAMPEP_0176241776 /NCGR_PEP_ID=MMETSP0121_2-20121125/30067_1 /TAXON_ID=160619 /ORGANISM="Kryptoperidinium foliaceum, Strain CCMP 1326" /LENGTH=149 /DNA_ID=CAMNT_0017581317 /DNA_START=273 /DNA_END=721 /DNA_ORIENTATION=+
MRSNRGRGVWGGGPRTDQAHPACSAYTLGTNLPQAASALLAVAPPVVQAVEPSHRPIAGATMVAQAHAVAERGAKGVALHEAVVGAAATEVTGRLPAHAAHAAADPLPSRAVPVRQRKVRVNAAESARKIATSATLGGDAAKRASAAAM